VAPEGVVNALRRVHAALVPGGILVDTQPISPWPPVEAGGHRLGTLDMREWRRTIDAVDGRIQAAVSDGLFTPGAEKSIVVADGFDDGAGFVEVVTAWQGTRIPAALAGRATSTDAPVQVLQDVRLRLFQARADD
jgi:hypothetical protein